MILEAGNLKLKLAEHGFSKNGQVDQENASCKGKNPGMRDMFIKLVEDLGGRSVEKLSWIFKHKGSCRISRDLADSRDLAES